MHTTLHAVRTVPELGLEAGQERTYRFDPTRKSFDSIAIGG
jgi:hypothetical protein